MTRERQSASKLRVLFICTGNACRSQMAEGLLRQMAGERFEVRSAGTHPWRVHPMTIDVMAERGIDMTGHASKSYEVFLGDRFDYVITTCDQAKQLCPNFPNEGERLHWSIIDPINALGDEEARRDAFRRTRNELAIRIERFIKRTVRGGASGRRFLY
ncbi:MAG: arsenate reductase ArsC [Acidobacteria bacterium]|nr:arsenate reductase ArsC [Acidobacteriota bacterium]